MPSSLARTAHVEAMISSWWGQRHPTDTAFQHIITRSERTGSPYPDLRWAAYYEMEGFGDPIVSQIASDLQYLSINLFGHPRYLRAGGKPVVFAYGGAESCATADRWAQAKSQVGGQVYIVPKVFSGHRSCPNQPNALHQYGPASRYDAQLPWSASVSLGYWKVGESPLLARDQAAFETAVQQMVRPKPTGSWLPPGVSGMKGRPWSLPWSPATPTSTSSAGTYPVVPPVRVTLSTLDPAKIPYWWVPAI